MKKVNSLLTYATAFAVLLSSCKDDAPEVEAGKTEMPTKFSSYTPAENKANLEDNGIELLNDMSDLQSSAGLKTSSSFVSLLSMAPAVPTNGRVMNMARTLKNYQEGKGSVHDIFATMRKTEEEPESIQAMYNMYIGVYNWNSQSEEWDYTKEGDKIVFKFPAVEGGASNNASFIIHSYKGVNTTTSLIEDYSGDLPTQLVTEIQVDGKKEVEYKFNASYNDKGEPISVSTSLMVNAFIFSISAENNTENVGAEYSLKKGEKILISMGAGAKGKFTAQQMEYADETGNAGDFAKEANAYFQLMNIKIAGNINIEKYADGQEAIYAGSDSADFDFDQAAEKEAALLNENFDLVVFYADSKEKIADTEIYTYTDTREEWTYWFDENGDFHEGSEDVEYTAMNIRMIFADGSPADLETYFSNGFEDLQAEISKFVAELEAGR